MGYWEEIGGRSLAGHTRCGVITGDHGLWVGSAEGGLWLGELAGSAWQPRSDMVYGGVDEVVAVPATQVGEPDVLLIRRGHTLHRSTNGGQTWEPPAGLPALDQFLTLQRLGGASDEIVALVRAHDDPNPVETRLYVSSDQGASFALRWTFPTGAPGDLWTPQTGSGGGSEVHVILGGTLYHSSDAGVSFTTGINLQTGVQESHLAGSEATSPATLYATTEVAGTWTLHRSDDGGATALALGSLNDYWGAARSLVGFPGDATVVVYAGVEAHRSIDSGESFTEINAWGDYYGDPVTKLHADVRGIDVQAHDAGSGLVDHLLLHTDGGTYLSTDRGATVVNLCLDGLGVGQFYSTLTSTLDPTRIAAGSQDQGYQLGHRAGYFAAGPSSTLTQTISGDIGHLVSADGSHNHLFAVYPGVVGSSSPGFVLIHEGETSPQISSVTFPAGNNSLWMPPLAADPTNPEAVFLGADQLWRLAKNGPNYQFQLHSTFDFAAGADSYLSAMSVAPTDPTRMVAVGDAGSIWWSLNSGVTWTAAAQTGPTSHLFYGSHLLHHWLDPLTVIVAGSGYGQPGVRISHDGGNHWEPLGHHMPETLFYDLAWGPDANGDLYAATEAGAWRYLTRLDRWEPIMGVEAPSTLYWSVERVPAANRMRFGTYGRGIW
ncbi:MAG: hypothetical protein R3F17_17250, partial [Planctomycetota bacterium]